MGELHSPCGRWLVCAFNPNWDIEEIENGTAWVVAVLQFHDGAVLEKSPAFLWENNLRKRSSSTRWREKASFVFGQWVSFPKHNVLTNSVCVTKFTSILVNV